METRYESFFDEIQAFFDEIQAPLLEVHERVKADMKVHAEEGSLTDLSVKMHCALNIFMRYGARENSWTRRLVGQAGFRSRRGRVGDVGEAGFTMENVEDVCSYVMEAIPLVPARESESLERFMTTGVLEIRPNLSHPPKLAKPSATKIS